MEEVKIVKLVKMLEEKELLPVFVYHYTNKDWCR